MNTNQNEVAPPATAGHLPLAPRAYLMKCEGHGLAICATCCRQLSPDAGLYQNWVAPRLEGGACIYFADVQRFASVYMDAPSQTREAKSDRGLLK